MEKKAGDMKKRGAKNFQQNIRITHLNTHAKINRLLSQYVVEDLILINKFYEYLLEKGLLTEFLDTLTPNERKIFVSSLKDKQNIPNLHI